MLPQRLSNDDDETTGAAPAMTPDAAGGGVLSNGVAFGGVAGVWAATWATACSGFAVSGFGFATA